MNQFTKSYAEIYDLIYQDKDYKAEADFVRQRLIASGSDYFQTSLLDIGCGTGRHCQEFKKLGFNAEGFDRSEEMIQVARNRFPGFWHTNPKSIGRIFDVITSLFHVFSYQTTDQEINKFFRDVRLNLRYGGFLFLDFWNKSNNQKYDKRFKKFFGEEIVVQRTSISTLLPEFNMVLVNFIADIERPGRTFERIIETHPMRYFSLSEIETLLNQNEFELIESGEWMTGKELTENALSGYVVARLK